MEMRFIVFYLNSFNTQQTPIHLSRCIAKRGIWMVEHVSSYNLLRVLYPSSSAEHLSSFGQVGLDPIRYFQVVQ